MPSNPTPITNWAATAGIWQFDNDKATYIKPDPRIPFGFGIAVSSARLRNGTIKASIDFGQYAKDNEARIIFGYSPLTRDYFSAGIGGYGNAYVIDEFVSPRGWQALGAAGSKENINQTTPYNILVKITGQQVTLLVNDIPVVQYSLNRPLGGDQVGLLAVGPGPVSFFHTVVDAGRPRAFVVMQYGEPFDSIYKEVIAPVCETMGLDAFRADDIYRPGIILQDIITGIVESEVVIAEITAPNPNVFYELGYSHALAKTTILLAERDKELPFDIRSYRCIFYDNTIGGKRDVEANLHKHLTNILREQ